MAAKAAVADVQTVLIVTAANLRQAAAVEAELHSRQDFGAIPPDWLVFTVPDPSSARVGSGGATLNALATVEDLLSECDAQGLSDSRIIMVHSGGDSQRLPSNSVCGKAWCAFPSLGVQNSLNAPIDILLTQIDDMFSGTKAGLIVSCSDVLLTFPADATFDWSKPGVTGLAIPMPKSYGPNHGVYMPAGGAAIGGGAETVERFFQKASVEQLTEASAVRSDDTVLLDSGIVYFDKPSTASLISLISTQPLEACTYRGPENGQAALRIELYSDIMLALGGGVGMTREQYMEMSTADANLDRVQAAREHMWAALNTVGFQALTVEGTKMAHVGTTKELLELLTTDSDFRRTCGFRSAAACVDLTANSAVEPGTPEDCVVMNSLLRSSGSMGSGSVIEHCDLSGRWSVGEGALCSSVRTMPGVRVRDNVALQEVHVSGHRVVTLWGVHDKVKAHYKREDATFCGQPWVDVLTATGMDADQLWQDVPDKQRSLWTAQLFAKFPLSTNSREPSRVAVSSGGSEDGSGWFSRSRSLASAVSDRDAALWLQDVRRPNAVAISRWKAAPRVSLKQLLQQADAGVEFSWRRKLRNQIEVARLCLAVRQNENIPLRSIVKRLVEAEGGGGNAGRDRDGGVVFTRTHNATLAGLDEIAATASYDVAAHALSLIGEMLWGIAGWGGQKGGRAGPVRHPDWTPSLSLLASCGADEHFAPAGFEGGTEVGTPRPRGDSDMASPSAGGAAGAVTVRSLAVAELASQRERWSTHRHLIGRAARHYERAAQILVGKCVSSSMVEYASVEAPALGPWVTAEAPARVDLSGGWSDTPPITFEAQHAATEDGGGVVANVAVQIDGQRPIGARCRKISDPVVKIRERECAPAERVEDAHEIRKEWNLVKLGDFDDHDSPHAPAALVKCALLCIGAVTLVGRDSAFVSTRESHSLEADDPNALVNQLRSKLGGGLEIETWSLLPAGSGMGTSSILSAAVLAAVSRVLGRSYSKGSLSLLCLRLEQILTTGGGWQDQVGGLYAGAKTGYCPAVLPLSIRVVPIEETTLGTLESHLLLVYTGKTRLAKNLLQRVLHQWTVRDDGIPEVVSDLCSNAEVCSEALRSGDIAKVGECLSTYWEQKKIMAPGSEPDEVAALLAVLQPHVYGASLCGAGGGGFLALVVKPSDDDAPLKARVEGILRSDERTAGLKWSVHSVSVDREGLRLDIDGTAVDVE